MSIVGARIGGYRVTGEIGRGGMGAVYAAEHERIGQRAAVKVLSQELSQSAEHVQRFLDEARAAGSVAHPGLVKVFDHGQLDDGTAYILMEYLPGESLRARLKRAGRLSLTEALRLGRQMAAALAAVHDRGIVHRDLKPENVILVPDPEADGGERAKIVDFGIAKIRERAEQAPAAGPMTTEGRFLGTAVYASPEQCRMAGTIGERSDVYSLGVMLYEMLAGQPPFQAPETGVVIARHILVQPPALRQLRPGLPPPAPLLIHQMLAKDQAGRPSMAEVVDRIAALEAFKQRPRWIRPASVAAALLALASAAGGVALWRRSPAPGGSRETITTGPPGPARSRPAAPVALPLPSVTPAASVALPPPPATPVAGTAAPAAARVGRSPAPTPRALSRAAPPATTPGVRAESAAPIAAAAPPLPAPARAAAAKKEEYEDAPQR